MSETEDGVRASSAEAVRPKLKLPKWPFYLADIVLSAIAAGVLYKQGVIASSTGAVVALGCIAAAAWAAWLSITPWLTEHRTQAALVDSTNLESAVGQIRKIEQAADLIRQANSQWQGVQDAAGRTMEAAREITEKMKVEADEFMNFMQKANDQERAGLRLEVEKLRRMEGDWIKVAVQMLDHTYAITRAAERSGNQNLAAQLGQFQNACRDAARRMGLSPFIPAVSEPFDPRGHQLPDTQSEPGANAKVGEILATGFTYQGQLLRRALVVLTAEEPEVSTEMALAEPAVPKQEEQLGTATQPDLI